MTPKTHDIPTTDSPYDYEKGHFKSEATLLIEGANRQGGPGGWFVGGWTAEGEGRTVCQGPMVPGPYAYVGGRCGVLAADPRMGTKGAHDRAYMAGLLFQCKDGDTLTLHGTDYTLTLDRRGYPSLTPKAN